MNRRELLTGSASLSLSLALSGTAWADATPKVYGDYTQVELDGSMDQTRWAPNMQAVLAKWKPESEKARKELHVLPVARYGDLPLQEIEAFPAERPASPIVFFVHGGEWKRAGLDTSAFPALSFVPAGCAFVNVGFRAAPQSTLVDMADDVQNAFLWTVKNAATFNGDPERIFVVGHSSGAHLAAVLLTRDLAHPSHAGRPIRGATLLSGLYDLEPVLLSARREWVKLTPQQGSDLSPLLHTDNIVTPTAVVFGSNDSPEFQRQGRLLAAALRSKTDASSLVVVPDANHFEIPQTFVDPEGAGTKIVLGQITALS